MPLTPGTRLGPYEIVAPLGAGGMGEVYRARDTRLARDVAIKILRELHGPGQSGIRARFEREAKTISSLNHPHICTLFDVGREGETDYLVMELVEGETLARRVSRGALPVADVLRLGTQIADALDRAHRSGVIHRDLTPGNVMLSRSGAKLMDFGLARAAVRGFAGASRDTTAAPLTAEGTIVGTFQYMAPEQLEGRAADARSDLWGLGCVLYEMATGRRAFDGATQSSLISAIMRDTPRPLAELAPMAPPALDRVVKQCLAKDPDDRWQTAGDLRRELSWIAEDSSGSWATGRAGDAKRPGVWPQAAIPWAVSVALLLGLAWVSVRGEHGVAPRAGPTRFNIELDPGVQPSFTPIVRLSSDGRQLFVTAMVNRREEVLHRSLDRTQMDVIQGAGQGDQGTGNSRPFVSPDGRWVAYAKQRKLWKVPVDGGPAIELAVADWAGGSWGRNGRLVYTQAYNTGLWMVSEGGGDERMLTKPDTTTGELGHWWPQFLPDGDHVLFTAYRTPIERATIEVLSIKSGKRKVLLAGGVFGFYVSTGHLLFAVGETIRAVPFDLRRLAVTGAALPVVDGVAMNPTDGAAAFDVSENGTLAYLPVSSYVTETDVVLVDRKGNESRALPASDRYNHPRLSPDGSRISVDIRSANSLGDVWVFQVGQVGGTRVTAEGGRDFGAEWSRDGRELIYSSEHPYFDLYRRVADASRPPEPLLTGTYDHYTGSVTPDGQRFAFVLSVPGGEELWTVPLKGPRNAARYFANGFNLAHPNLSPDGRWMAYDSDESGRVEVFVQSYPDPLQKRWKVSAAHGSEPMWTRGGRELVYRNGDSVMAVSIDPENGRSSGPRLLFAGPYPDNPGWTRPRSYDVTPDGERFLMTKLPGEQPRPRIAMVLNWFDELRTKVPR